MRHVTRLVLIPVIFLATALAGCSTSGPDAPAPPATPAAPATSQTTPADDAADDKVIPQAKVETEITDSLEKSVGKRPDAVKCPGGLPAQQGKSIRCVLHAGADQVGVTATVTSASVKGNKVDYKLAVKVDG